MKVIFQPFLGKHCTLEHSFYDPEVNLAWFLIINNIKCGKKMKEWGRCTCIEESLSTWNETGKKGIKIVLLHIFNLVLYRTSEWSLVTVKNYEENVMWKLRRDLEYEYTIFYTTFCLFAQVVFEQFRLVVAAHQSVLGSMRSSADKHGIEVHLYSMPDVWSKVQAAVSTVASSKVLLHVWDMY